MEANEQQITLKAKNLEIGYKTGSNYISIVKDIDFESKAGELTAIVGINGIGKSTLLRTLGRVQPELAGTIEMENKNLGNFKPIELASKISVVLTEPIASKNMTVSELVALGRQPYTNWIGNLSTEDKNKISAALNMLELNGLKNKKMFRIE